MPQVEMGQGVYTSISMILAEELDADFSRVALEHAPPSDKLYGNPMFGIQATGNSNSIRSFWKPLRVAGASARAMLVTAAATQWQVDPASCSASNGKVTHGASGRVAAYGDLVDAASNVPVLQNPPLKDPKDFALIGKPVKRLDTPNKTDGKVVYGIDALLPGMKFATLAQCPAFDRSSCWTTWSRWSAIIPGRPRRASMLSSSPGTKGRTSRSVQPISGTICAPPAK